MLCGLVLILFSFGALVKCQSVIEAPSELKPNFVDETGTIECHRRPYRFKVTQADENGKQCWDILIVNACWGRCDSNEISDWRFPYKKSNHPVCVYYGRTRSEAILRNCDEGTNPDAARYVYLEAEGCKCQQCSSSDTSCEGLRYRPQRSHPASLGFRIN